MDITLEQMSYFTLLYNKSRSKHCEGLFPRQDITKPLEAVVQTTSASALLRTCCAAREQYYLFLPYKHFKFMSALIIHFANITVTHNVDTSIKLF